MDDRPDTASPIEQVLALGPDRGFSRSDVDLPRWRTKPPTPATRRSAVAVTPDPVTVMLMAPGVDLVAALEQLVARPQWHARAACRGMGAALFHPPRGGHLVAAEARAVCDECPVVDDCLDDALARGEHETPGIWGGTTAQQRRSMRRATAA